MFPEPKAYTPDELRVGLAAEFEREISEDDVLSFARNSGDQNPMHVDAAYARTTSYQGRIVHGAFQVGLASALLGMHLPGHRVLLGSVNARFVAPLYFPCRVRVRGEITAWNRQALAGQLRVVVQEAATGAPTAEVFMGFTLHEQRPAPEAARPAPAGALASPAQRVVLVTGAAGGLGAALALELARDYAVLGAFRSQPLAEALKAHANVSPVQLDLDAPGWEDGIRAALGNRALYGIVHAAWPGAPRGGLLQVQDDVLERQLLFATTATVRLARLLYERVGPEGGRLVALGSMAGRAHPALPLAAYSLAKAALEHTVALLAPELARKRVTINAICPSYVAAGLNRQGDERARKREAALVPLGRLCTPEDVVAMARFLLSDEAAFASGQCIALSGGQL
jgi:NAD(P)-dependent dehydrogenase (short-subunit alcohol dehydrogenase family)/acyl dehydratase